MSSLKLPLYFPSLIFCTQWVLIGQTQNMLKSLSLLQHCYCSSERFLSNVGVFLLNNLYNILLNGISTSSLSSVKSIPILLIYNTGRWLKFFTHLLKMTSMLPKIYTSIQACVALTGWKDSNALYMSGWNCNSNTHWEWCTACKLSLPSRAYVSRSRSKLSEQHPECW